MIKIGERNWQCEECGHAAKTKTALEVHKNGVHRKTDLKKGLFICDFVHNGIECKLTFTARKYYKQHRKHHARDMKKLEQTDVYPFQCYLCISSFKKEGFLKKHISQFHEDQNPEPCPICSHVFMNGQQGGFQLEFVSIRQVINHMTCYKLECSHWLKLQYSDWREYFKQ